MDKAQQYSAAEVERMMKLQDVLLKAMAKKISWGHAAETGVMGRWHDNRHTLITDLAESGAGEETIREIAGHVSPRMLKHYSHIRMEAKRKALEAIVPKPELVAPVCF